MTNLNDGDAFERAGEFNQLTAQELCWFMTTVNSWSPPGFGTVDISLSGLTGMLNDPRRIINVLMSVLGQRCRTDEQLLTCAAEIMVRFQDLHSTEVNIERLVKAAELLKNTQKAME